MRGTSSKQRVPADKRSSRSIGVSFHLNPPSAPPPPYVKVGAWARQGNDRRNADAALRSDGRFGDRLVRVAI